MRGFTKQDIGGAGAIIQNPDGTYSFPNGEPYVGGINCYTYSEEGVYVKYVYLK